MRRNEHRRIQRVPTHVPGLDTVLGGGLLRGGIYVIMGAPGSGKTILGNQICFATARHGGRAAYVTLLAESHARMMLHLETVDFFDPAAAGDGVRYLSAYDAFSTSGLRGVLDFLRAELHVAKGNTRKPSGPVTIVIDGFLVLSDASRTVDELKKFIQELQLYADLMGATVLLLAGPAMDQSRPEYTMVDGIIELREEMASLRAYREIRVRKLRGAHPVRGGHVFEIGDGGIVVHPRVEALLRDPSPKDGADGTLTGSGVPALDVMLGGGLRTGTSMLVVGPSGSGKSTLGLHFLAATPRKEKALYFGFSETPDRLAAKASRLGLGIDARIRRSDIELVWQASTERRVDTLAARLFAALDRSTPTRVVIDGLEGFERATAPYPERAHAVFSALANELRVRGITALSTLEVTKVVGADLELPVRGASTIADALVSLRHVERGASHHRLLSVLKARDAEHDASLHEFKITNKGIRLEATSASAEAILARDPVHR